MEARDQVTQDQIHFVDRPWGSLNEVEQGALLVDLGVTLKKRLMFESMDRTLAQRYRAFANAAIQTGNALVKKHRVPFVPDPPYRWATIHPNAMHEKAREITVWAGTGVAYGHHSVKVLHPMLDLRNAGWELEKILD